MKMPRTLLGRYLLVAGAILAVLLAGAYFTRPSMDHLRRAVTEALEAYAKAKPGDPKLKGPAAETETQDYLVAMRYAAKLPSGETFSCIGAFKVTFCLSPD